MEQAIHVKDLKKVFSARVKGAGFKESLKGLFSPEIKKVEALKGVSFEVARGEILAFIGPNGAGKSTTIKLITGILYPDGGEVSVLGMNPHKQRKQLAYRIGTVFGQKSQLWFHLPPVDSFYLLGSIYDLSPHETRKRVDFLAEVFEIGDFVRQPVRKLSLGQRIRCEIVASLIHNPDVLFLDEPSIGLDVVVKQKIRDLILRINRESQVTIFLTSHDAGDIEKLCQKAMVINNGELVWEGSIKQMKYSLLNKRVIHVKLDNSLKLDMDGVKILKAREYSAKVEIDLNRVSLEMVIQEIMRRNSILDITISTTPMEEVISMIFKGAV